MLFCLVLNRNHKQRRRPLSHPQFRRFITLRTGKCEQGNRIESGKAHGPKTLPHKIFTRAAQNMLIRNGAPLWCRLVWYSYIKDEQHCGAERRFGCSSGKRTYGWGGDTYLSVVPLLQPPHPFRFIPRVVIIIIVLLSISILLVLCCVCPAFILYVTPTLYVELSLVRSIIPHLPPTASCDHPWQVLSYVPVVVPQPLLRYVAHASKEPVISTSAHPSSQAVLPNPSTTSE